ncbi:hypothetical protein ZWY2020_016180 [Hordeum vulgare]|nr:hypothetical protein ZWY2020_016180 [Hordeum vulgare]
MPPKAATAMVDAARPACILETRKTAPGLRLVDKWAVLIVGGKNHKLGLFDMVMIKDNHISVAGGITNAITSVNQFLVKENLAVLLSGALTHSVKAVDISLKIDTELALQVGRRTNRA